MRTARTYQHPNNHSVGANQYQRKQTHPGPASTLVQQAAGPPRPPKDPWAWPPQRPGEQQDKFTPDRIRERVFSTGPLAASNWASRPGTSPVALFYLAQYPDTEVQLSAAKNPRCPEQALQLLLRSPYQEVAEQAAANPNLSAATRAMWQLGGAWLPRNSMFDLDHILEDPPIVPIVDYIPGCSP